MCIRDRKSFKASGNQKGKVTLETLWREARKHGWLGTETYWTPTPEELAQQTAKEEADKAELARKRTEAAKKAEEIWEAALEAKPDHPYLTRKQVSPVDTLREIPVSEATKILGYTPKSNDGPLTGRLLIVPVKVGGRLSTVEMIDEAGLKSSIAHGAKGGGYWAAQPLPEGANDDGLHLMIGEGVATVLSARDGVATIVEAGEYLSIAALSAGNLGPVAKAMRERYPKATLVILADLVKATGEPEPQAIEAALAVGGRLAVPDFGDNRPEGATDFNDMAVHRGLEAVGHALVNGGDSERPDWRAAVERLAKLPLNEYDYVREAEAKALKVRVSTLDKAVAKARGETNEETNGQGQPFTITEPEPWPEAVEGAALLDELAATFRRFVVLADHSYTIAALWVLHTYAFALGHVTPILAVVSPEKGCGKTTLRDTLAALVRAALSTDGVSAAALFRVIQKWRPTVLLDDFDSWGKDNEELRGVLNTGYRKGGVYIRCVGDDQDPRGFTTFAPKCINLIGKLRPTLTDRSITITMHRKLRGERIDSLHEFDGAELQRKSARWVADNEGAIKTARPDMGALFNRQADNWRPLLALAAVAGGDWPKRATAAVAATLDDDDATASSGVMLLGDIRDLFERRAMEGGTPRRGARDSRPLDGRRKVIE